MGRGSVANDPHCGEDFGPVASGGVLKVRCAGNGSTIERPVLHGAVVEVGHSKLT